VVGDRVWFFGGQNASGSLQDLHCLDIAALQVVRPIAAGPAPPAGANPLMVAWRGVIVVWASAPRSFIYILDTDAMKWDRVSTEAVFRLGTTGAVVGDTLYVFGSSIEMTLLAMDLRTCAISAVRTTGIELSDERLTIAAVGSVVFAFETSGQQARERLFVLDTDRLMWHCHAVTNEVSEGAAAIVAFYIKGERRIVGVWGAAIAELQLGAPLAQINHNLDLLAGLGEVSRV
jgi:hypothetical protein